MATDPALSLQESLFNVVALSAKDTEEGSINGQLKVTIDAFAMEVPITAEFFGCDLTSLKFSSAKMSVDYTVGTGPSEVTIPEII